MTSSALRVMVIAKLFCENEIFNFDAKGDCTYVCEYCNGVISII
jgi:hypothetical protein